MAKKLHHTSVGQTPLQCIQETINQEFLRPLFSIYPWQHPSLSELCWCQTDRAVEKWGLIMT